MAVHGHAGAGQTEHDVIAVQQLRDRRLDGETPVVAALVHQRRQERGQRTVETVEIHLSHRQAHGGDSLRG